MNNTNVWPSPLEISRKHCCVAFSIHGFKKGKGFVKNNLALLSLLMGLRKGEVL